MKKLIFTFVTLALCSYAWAQHRVYGTIGTSNRASSWTNSFDIRIEPNASLPDGYQHKIRMILSKGYNANAAIGIQKDRLKLEIGLHAYRASEERFQRDESELIGISFGGFAYEYSKLDYSSTTQMTSLHPKLFYRFKDKKMSPYVSIGLNITRIDISYDLAQDYSYKLKTVNARLFDGISWGHQLNFGLDFKINERFNVFGDIGYINHQYRPKLLTIQETVEHYQKNETIEVINEKNIELQQTNSTNNKRFNLFNANMGISITIHSL